VFYGFFKQLSLFFSLSLKQKAMPFDPLLATCFEGLIEDKHPYNFIAFNCIKEMLE